MPEPRCPKGHKFAPEPHYWDDGGYRFCETCHKYY